MTDMRTAPSCAKPLNTKGAWRREWDSNPLYAFTHTRFPSVRLKPLGHPSAGGMEASRVIAAGKPSGHPTGQNGEAAAGEPDGPPADDQAFGGKKTRARASMLS